MGGEIEACLDAGMNDHMLKPYHIEDLLKTVRKWTHTEADIANQKQYVRGA